MYQSVYIYMYTLPQRSDKGCGGGACVSRSGTHFIRIFRETCHSKQLVHIIYIVHIIPIDLSVRPLKAAAAAALQSGPQD